MSYELINRKPQKPPTPNRPQTQAMGSPGLRPVEGWIGGSGDRTSGDLYFLLAEKGDPTSNHLF